MTKKANGITRYTTYNFTDHDPLIDVIDTAFQDAKRRDKSITISKVSGKSRVAPATMTNWLSRKTKRPQAATLAAVAVALGMDTLPITPEARRRFREGLK